MSGPAAPAILAIEDEPRNAALLRALFRTPAYELEVATTLTQGRQMLATAMPDVLLMDRHLPDGDGLDLVRELRSWPAAATLPILMVSASVLPDDRAVALDAGCTAFVTKPINTLGLLAEVRAHVRT